MFVWNEKCITVFHISLPGIASAISEGSCNYETASFVGFTEFISIQVFTLWQQLWNPNYYIHMKWIGHKARTSSHCSSFNFVPVNSFGTFSMSIF